MIPTDLEVIAELHRVRSNWVEACVARRVNDSLTGEPDGCRIDRWEDEAFEQWNSEHPALVQLLGTEK